MTGNTQGASDGVCGDRSVTTLVGVYNRFLVDMVQNMKSLCPEVSQAVGAKYKALDPDTDYYIRHAAACLRENGLLEGPVDTHALLDHPDVQNFEPLPGVPIAMFVNRCHTDSSTEPCGIANAVMNYVYILATLAATYREASVGDESALVKQVLRALAQAQATHGGGELGSHESHHAAFNDALGCIMHPTLAALLQRVADCNEAQHDGVPKEEGADEGTTSRPQDAGMKADPLDMENLMNALGGSKIAELAKEISQEVDLSALPVPDDPAELLDFTKLADNQSLLGNIVSKVGTKIQNKLRTGELKQEDLLGDALSMLQKMGGSGAGNPLLSNLFKSMGGFKNAGAHGQPGRTRQQRPRDRLLRAMQQRQADARAAP